MQFDFVTLEVDGSLRNPVVILAVTTWACILAIVSAFGAIAWVRSRAAVEAGAQNRGVAAVLGVALLYMGTPVAQAIIGNVIYALQAKWDGGPDVVSVGFWGGPPVWPAPLVGLVAAYVVFRRARSRRSVASARA